MRNLYTNELKRTVQYAFASNGLLYTDLTSTMFLEKARKRLVLPYSYIFRFI